MSRREPEMNVTIRRCAGNTDAWGAFLGEHDWCMGTSMSLDGLADILKRRYPGMRLAIKLELAP